LAPLRAPDFFAALFRADDAPRFVLAERPADFDRPEAALREPAAPRDDADLALPDFLRFVLPLLALRFEALLPDFPRDFLALVAM
jgi:hypothetical protein